MSGTVIRVRLAGGVIPFRGLVLAAMLAAIVAGGGCATSGIGPARNHFYGGRLEEAGAAMAMDGPSRREAVLFLMERGMIRQVQGDFEGSIQDWLAAADRIRTLDQIRLSEKAASMVINDRTEIYTGQLYERALLHAFTAKSYLALGQWREAAVEARLIADLLADRRGFPDDAYTRYVAGLAFELIGDAAGARLEYSRAEDLTPDLRIDPASGQIAPSGQTPDTPAADGGELICLITIGRAPGMYAAASAYPNRAASAPYAEIVYQGRRLGRSHTLNTTARLADLTARRLAAIKTAKTVSRIIVKESLAHAVGEKNPVLGELLRLTLWLLEMPDTRHWETLPYWLQVARVPCPADLESFELVYPGGRTGGRSIRRTVISRPLAKAPGKRLAVVRAW